MIVAEREATTSREREVMLIGRARAGDRIALRELVDAHKDRLFAFIWRMVRNHHEAEDICQDAFLKAFASLDTFSCEYRFSTWLFTIGYRVCLNRLRRKRSFTGDLEFSSLAAQDEAGSSAALESEEAVRVRNSVWSAVDQLTPPQRAAILLFYRNDFGCQEIARVLQLPLATVKSHLHRARVRLRELLEGLPDQDWSSFRNLSERAV